VNDPFRLRRFEIAQDEGRTYAAAATAGYNDAEAAAISADPDTGRRVVRRLLRVECESELGAAEDRRSSSLGRSLARETGSAGSVAPGRRVDGLALWMLWLDLDR
jgi:hypothetical protein